MTVPTRRFANDDDAAQHWLILLRDGNDDQKIHAREQLAAIFERRGMYEEATELLIANVHDGVRSADIFRWLARLYRHQGQEVLAMQAAAEAAKYLAPPAAPQALVVSTTPAPYPGQEGAAWAAGATQAPPGGVDRLAAEIRKYVSFGYRVVNQTPTSAQLVKPKEFSALWAILWFLVCGVGVLVYIFYYMGQSDTTIHLSLNPDGTVIAQSSHRSGPPRLGDRWACPSCGWINSWARETCKRTTCRLPRP